MRKFLFCTLGLLIGVGLFFKPVTANAVSGTPGSPRFGYGSRLQLANPQTEIAIQTAGNIDLDWIAIDFDWAAFSPRPDTNISWTSLDRAVQLVQGQEISILISITNPPDWALTAAGPDPELTSRVISQLIARYPQNILAVEVFPGPNTTTGWRANPNPQAYVDLLKTIHHKSLTHYPGIIMVSGGLTPGLPETNVDFRDLVFLEKMYAAGAAEITPIIGLRLIGISSDPTQVPESFEDPAIRHYEAIRSVMLANNHTQGLIWVTAFSWDENQITSPQEQAIWLKQAYLMMRSQLYIGIAIFESLNASDHNDGQNALIQSHQELHPGIDSLREIIAYEYSQHSVTFYLKTIRSIQFKPGLKP